MFKIETGNIKARMAFFVFQVIAIKYKDPPVSNIGVRKIPKMYPLKDYNYNMSEYDNVEINEVDVFTMKTNPQQINISYKGGAHNAVRTGGILSDESGIFMTRIKISGNTGYKARRVGIEMIDGWSRFLNFRENVFKLSHTLNIEKATELLFGVYNDKITQYEIWNKLVGENIVYAINFYDFWNNEYMAIDIDSLNIGSKAEQGRNSTYNMDIIGLGDIIDVKTTDPALKYLQSLQWASNKARALTGQANAYLNSNELAQIGGVALGGLDVLDVAGESLLNAVEMLPDIKATLQGNAFTNVIQNAKSNWSKIMAGLQ